MNWDFANSTYPVAPDGASIRVRIDKIGVSETYPEGEGNDGGWFINADYRHGASGWYDPATDIDWALIHELSHQVSIIDLYAIGAEAPNLLVTDRLGNPINMGFSWPRPDLMGGGDIWPHTDGHLYSSHVAGGASTYKGYRNGYYGSYLFDIPLDNYFLVLDSQGNPAPGVEITLYQRNGTPDWTGAPAFDAPADISGTTDASGIFLLTNRPVNGGTVTNNGHVLHDNPFGVIDIIGSQNLFLVQLRQGNHEEYHWLDITEFNLAYWLGDTISHTFAISSHVPPPAAPLAPIISSVQVQGDWTKICWQESPSLNVTGYRLYRATRPISEFELVTNVASGPCLEDTYSAGSYGGKTYTVTALNEAGLESGFSNYGWAPTLINPMALVTTPQGEHIILDPRNGYALIRQAANGDYRQYVGSVHFHLENSQFMALDANNHLIFSHPGDWYTTRHSVRVADQTGTPLLEFGDQGSGSGQFETPTGVAGWGKASSYSGPYEPDAHTLLLLHLDGSYDGAQGEPGTSNGTTFVTGRYGKGALVDGNDTLSYTASGNITFTQGAVEFWFRPNWNGDDGGNHTLFWWGEDPVFFHLRKDGISNLVFDRFFDGGSCGAPINVADWKAGEWHHLAFTWEGTDMVLYVDGRVVAQTVCEGVANPGASIFYIGSGIGGDQSVDGIIDEFRVSDMPRLGNSDTAGIILVADSGNHRVQAFDDLGNFISEYGSYGSGDGQFNNPQGLAADPIGRVIVVDRGNNRLVALSFDGRAFSYLDSYTAGFKEPTSVAVDGWGNLVVADTGNNRIIVLDPQGNLLTEYDQPNDSYLGSFNAPQGVAVDQYGNLVIADTGNSRVVSVHRLKKTCLPLVIH
jgi:sugar lactone lactonase YvrE